MANIVKYVPPSTPFQTDQALMLLGEESQSKLLALARTVEAMISRVEAVEIASDGDAIKLNDLLAGAKIASDKLEADRAERKAPILAEGRAIDALYKPTSDAFGRIKDAVRRKLSDHLKKKQDEAARRLAESERLKEEARKMQEMAFLEASKAATDAERKAAEAQIDNAQSVMIDAHRAAPLEAVVTGVRSEMARSSLRFRKVAKLVDITRVPREYLEEAIMIRPELVERVALSAAKNGVEQIPGIEIFEDQVLSTRVGLQ